MTETTPNLDQLEQAEQEAIRRVAEARTAAEQVRIRAQHARAQAEHDHDLHVLEQWRQDRAQLDADVDAAWQRFHQAVLEDPVFAALADYLLAAHRRTTRSMEAGQTTARVHGPEAGFGSIPNIAAPPWTEIAQVVERAATDRGRDEAAAREQARVDAGQAAADREAGR